jgi:competence CoiA-like predicted nuclease
VKILLTCIYKGEKICSLDYYDSHELYVELKKASKSSKLYCEECGELVVFHGGDKRIYHFKHQTDSQCPYGALHESRELLEAKKFFYENLKKYFSNYNIKVDYKHPNGKRSHFYIPELKMVLHLQKGNSDLEEWGNRLQDLEKEGIEGKWYFISERTHAMERATFTLNENNIFRKIDVLRNRIRFKSEFEIDEYLKGIEIEKSYSLDETNILEGEELFKNYLSEQREKALQQNNISKKEFLKNRKEIVKSENSTQNNEKNLVHEGKEECLMSILEGFKKDSSVNEASKRLYKDYSEYFQKGILHIIERLKGTDVRIIAFILKYFFITKENSIGYFEKDFEKGMYFLNPKDRYEVIEIKNIENGQDVNKGKIYNYRLDEAHDIEVRFFRKKNNEESYLKVEFGNKEIDLKFKELNNRIFLVQEHKKEVTITQKPKENIKLF